MVVASCYGAYTCAPGYAGCVGRAGCRPGEKRCRGSMAEVCMPSGLGFDKLEDCEASGQACKAGSCVDGPCEPADEVCGPDGLYSRDGCGQTHLAWCCSCGINDDSASIGPFPFCIDGGYAVGAKFCVNDAVDVCGDDGGPVPCDSDSSCENGVCKPRPSLVAPMVIETDFVLA